MLGIFLVRLHADNSIHYLSLTAHAPTERNAVRHYDHANLPVPLHFQTVGFLRCSSRKTYLPIEFPHAQRQDVDAMLRTS